MKQIPMPLLDAGAYDRCVFTVAAGLNAEHGLKAVHVAAQYAARAGAEDDGFSADFWKDVLRAIDATSPDPVARMN